jgi:nucleoside phosphorylase
VRKLSGHRNVVVILTALSLEYNAVRTHLSGVQTQTHPAGTRFEIGMLPGTRWQIALATTGDGNTTAAVLVERAISLFAPEALLFVGVAGALTDDIVLGDVVVPTRVYAYHGGRDENHEFKVRPQAWQAPHHLEQLARHVERSRSWTQLLPKDAREHPPAVHFRPIAAGEVVLNSRTSPLAQQIRRHYNDAAAIEMESAGVAQASHLNRSRPVMTVRGISDTASGNKDATDRAGWQQIAAANAAAFALALVAELASASTPLPAKESPRWSNDPSKRGSVGRVEDPSKTSSNRDRGQQSRITQILTALTPLSGRPAHRSYRWVIGTGIAALLAAILTLGLVTLMSSLNRDQPDSPARSETEITSSRAPFTPRRPTDPSLLPEIQQEKTVELITDDPERQTIHIDYWRHSTDPPGDLRVDRNRLYTSAGAGIALLSGVQQASYAQCAALPTSAWTTEIPLADLAPGVQLCGYSTEDRYAVLQVISLPSASDRRFIFFGRTWQRAD